LRQKRVSFGTAFLATRFASSRSIGQQVGGDGGEHLRVESAAALFLAGGDSGDGLAVVVSGVARARKANPFQGDMGGESGLTHEGANQVVSDEMHLDFFVDHGRGSAAEHIHLQGGFDVIPIEFDFPAAVIERRQQVDGPEFRIGQGGHQGDSPAAAVGGLYAHAHHAHGQGRRHLLPLGLGKIGRFLGGFTPGDQPITRPEPPPLAKVTVAAGVEVKQAVSLVAEPEGGQGAIGTEVAVGHQDVTWAKSGPQVLEQLVFTDDIRGGGLLQEGPGFEAEGPHQPHQRKPATWLLVGRRWAKLAIGGRVREVKAGAVDGLERALARDA